jgi:hypothetical protein
MTTEIQIDNALEYQRQHQKTFTEEPCPIVPGIINPGENVSSTDALANLLVYMTMEMPFQLMEIAERCPDMETKILKYDDLCRPQDLSDNIKSFVDTMMFRPTRAKDWDPYLERLPNPKAIHNYCMNYNLDDVNGYAIGIEITYKGKPKYVIADHNHDTTLSVIPFIVPKFIAHFVDKSKSTPCLKDNYTPEAVKAFVLREFTENPRFVKFTFMPTPKCPPLCSDIVAIETRLTNLFMGQFVNGSEMPKYITNTNAAHLPDYKWERRVSDCLRSSMEKAGTAFGPEPGYFRGDAKKLLQDLRTRVYNWNRNAVAGFKFAHLVSTNRKTTWDDTDPQVFDSFVNIMEYYGFAKQNVDVFENADTTQMKEFMDKLVRLASMTAGTAALQATLSAPYTNNVIRPHGKYFDKKFKAIDKFEVAARWLFVKFVDVYGEQSLVDVFGRKGKYDSVSLHRFELDGSNATLMVQEAFDLSYTDSNHKTKNLLKGIDTQSALNAKLNPNANKLEQLRSLEAQKQADIDAKRYDKLAKIDEKIAQVKEEMEYAY